MTINFILTCNFSN